ncbi:unnamed protein product [Allacma fusca]|uniref:DUF962 domain-containing protein n=2 Tax=Allacma fusca TaxID=39272 RepID=A0A8J2JI70_9HEXA|nr:unnamed protein product [Allacma fusca]
MSIVDLDKQFVFYASYHHDKINKLIHIVCVWPILWSAMVFCQYAPIVAPDSLNNLVSFAHPLNLAFIVALFYATCYILMEQKAGTFAAGLVFLSLLFSRSFFLTAEAKYGHPAWVIALVIHVGCWIAQFVGHGKFEGRAPALLDNLVQAFLMAPLFVLLEVLFTFGYRQTFQKVIWKKVEQEIARVKAASKSSKRK